MKMGARAGAGRKGRGLPPDPEATAGPHSMRMRTRLRAAWMYHVERMTQNEIADALRIGRVTVVRLLADAAARNEVKVTIEGDLAELVAIERRLERQFKR